MTYTTGPLTDTCLLSSPGSSLGVPERFYSPDVHSVRRLWPLKADGGRVGSWCRRRTEDKGRIFWERRYGRAVGERDVGYRPSQGPRCRLESFVKKQVWLGSLFTLLHTFYASRRSAPLESSTIERDYGTNLVAAGETEATPGLGFN